MDAKLKCYVVMKAVSLLSSERGKSLLTRLVKLEKYSPEEELTKEFGLKSLWKQFYSYPTQLVEGIIFLLMKKDFVCKDTITIDNQSLPMFAITKKGRILLNELEKTELKKLSKLTMDYGESNNDFYDYTKHNDNNDFINEIPSVEYSINNSAA